MRDTERWSGAKDLPSAPLGCAGAQHRKWCERATTLAGGWTEAGAGGPWAMSNSTRLTLLERVRDTTTGESWKEFADVYDTMVMSWLRAQGVQPHDADDIRQEVLSAVYQQIGSFQHNGRPGAFRNWLRKITSNRLHRLWQKRGSRPAEVGPDLSELADQLGDPNSPLAATWDREHNRYVVEFLLDQIADRFSTQSMRVFERIALNEEPAQKVADDMGITLGAARVAQHRVLKALRELGKGWID